MIPQQRRSCGSCAISFVDRLLSRLRLAAIILLHSFVLELADVLFG